jgi:GPH family glycoside/pentoside/hexuronide:cation symporter
MSEQGIEKVSGRMRVAFAFGEIGDNIALNIFNFLLFIFYFTVVKVPVLWLSAGMVLWSVWNAINDPLIGYLSDRTKTKRGRRVPWMMVATIPLAILMILLFTPPVGLNSDIANFLYFMIILMLFDTVYTAFNLNYNALF